jgi:hypothetical protein
MITIIQSYYLLSFIIYFKALVVGSKSILLQDIKLIAITIKNIIAISFKNPWRIGRPNIIMGITTSPRFLFLTVLFVV